MIKGQDPIYGGCNELDADSRHALHKLAERYGIIHEIFVQNFNPEMKIYEQDSPSYLTDGKQILQLCLNCNPIENMRNFPEEIYLLKKLKSLSIALPSASLISKGFETLIDLKNLTLHLLSNPTIFNDAFLPVNVEKLHLIFENGSAIPRWICNFAQLKELTIEFDDYLLEDWLFDLNFLESLFLLGSPIYVPDLFYRFQNLKFLSVNCMNLKNGLHFLRNMKSLEELVVDAFEQNIPESIATLNNLRLLELTGDFNYIPDSIDSLINLETLVICNGNIESLPDTIGHLQGLKKLILETPKLKIIPDSFWNLIWLEELNIQGAQIVEISERIGNLKSLKRLILCDNEFQELPSTLGDLKGLLELYLTGNKLKELPVSIQGLINLRILAIEKKVLDDQPILSRILPWAEIIYPDQDNAFVSEEEMQEICKIEKI